MIYKPQVRNEKIAAGEIPTHYRFQAQCEFPSVTFRVRPTNQSCRPKGESNNRKYDEAQPTSTAAAPKPTGDKGKGKGKQKGKKRGKGGKRPKKRHG